MVTDSPPPTAGPPARGTPGGRGGGWVAGQVVLMLAVWLSGWWLPGTWAARWPAAVAGLLLVAGAGVGIAGAVRLHGGRTIFPEPPAGAVLVESGIYRHIRHPLYLSVVLLSLAWGWWRHSAPCLATAAVLAGYLIAKAAAEERRLCRRFPGYPAYQRRTARFIPGIW
jgi:protein-S-isoprenylcysteine O-methyltransferase Ste14